MPYVGFELTIPASERAKTVHALDRAATVTGHRHELLTDNCCFCLCLGYEKSMISDINITDT
jgi:hypothetical protein